MRLLSLTVGGYRNIEKTTIELGGITAFVAPNNYGKSNLLDAIQFATNFINASPRTRRLMMGYVGGTPLAPALANSDFCFQAEFEDPSLDDYRFVRYGFSFSWAKDDGTGRAITDEIIATNSQHNGRWTNYLRRDKGKYKKSHDTRSFRSIHLNADQLAIDILGSIEDIAINKAIKKIKEIEFSLCASIDASWRFHPMQLEMKTGPSNGTMAAFDDEDIPRALYRLKVNHSNRYVDLLSALFTLFPEFEEISVNPYELRKEQYDALERQPYETTGAHGADDVPIRIRNELYRMTVRSSHLNQPVDMSMMSAGTKRIVWLLTNVVIAEAYEAQCIGVEEIETSIHPKMLGELLELLDENTGDTSLLITSHSPYLIQYLKPRQIYIGVQSEDGVARFKRIREDRVERVNAYAFDKGLGFGEYLFELMSSDEDGSRMLTSVLED